LQQGVVVAILSGMYVLPMMLLLLLLMMMMMMMYAECA
jgi:hypothetical protein